MDTLDSNGENEVGCSQLGIVFIIIKIFNMALGLNNVNYCKDHR